LKNIQTRLEVIGTTQTRGVAVKARDVSDDELEVEVP
jgi:hypothetical protein